jgi:hypothetical protein
MAKILILIGAHICTTPHPQKEAETLVFDLIALNQPKIITCCPKGDQLL